MAKPTGVIALIAVLVAAFITLQGCDDASDGNDPPGEAEQIFDNASDGNDPPGEAEQLFDDFIKTHGKQYDEVERSKRFQVFTENVKRIGELNAKEAGTAEYSLRGPFADWSPDEFVAHRLIPAGVLEEEIQVNLRRRLTPECPKCTSTDVPLLNTSNLPIDFDWRTRNAITPVQDQKCNDCWAFSSTAHLESAHVVQAGGALTKFSEQQAIDCSPGSCSNGSQAFTVWRYLVNTNDGLSTLADYPYRSECADCDALSASHGCSATEGGPKVRDWRKIAWDERPANEDQMAAAVMKYGPIIASVDVSGLQFYAGKVTRPVTGNGSDATCTTATNHIVNLVGFGEEDGVKYWLIKNSYGTGWGEDGYLKMERGTGACGVNSAPMTAIMEPPTYVKADGGPAGCPDRDQVDTAEECRKAGEMVGHPFEKVVTTDATTVQRPGGCFWDVDGLSYFNTNRNASATWAGVGAICRGVYEKAAGAADCRQDQMVKTAEECRIAGATVGHPFDKVVTTGDVALERLQRPGGCFWDQNGFSYFNTNLSASTSSAWAGVGGLCRVLRK